LRNAAKRLPYSTKVSFALAALYERHKDEASARKVYEAVVKEYDKKPAGFEAKVRIAQLDFADGKREEAERRLTEVLKENPRSAEGLILQGKIELAKRHGKEAVQAFRTALRDQPEQAHVQFLLGQAHVITGEALLARESFERAVSLHPGLVDSTLALAMLDSQNGQTQRARARLREVVKTQRDHLPTIEMLFALDLMAGDWKQAKATLAQLRSVAGEGAMIFMAEGKLHEAQREFAEAQASFEKAAAATPNAPEPLLALIRLEVAQKQTDRARRRLETLVSMRPDHPYGHGLLGEVLMLSGRQEEAVTHFREATRISPTWVTPWVSWANLSIVRGQPEEAIRILNEGVVANKSSEELYMLMASILSNQGQIEGAITAYESVLRLNPRNIFSANNLASLLVDHKSDAASLERAFALSRDFEKEAPHPLFLDTLGWVRLKMGQPDQALRLLKQAIAKAPDLPTLNYHLGSALYQSGQRIEAKMYLSKALKSTETFQGRREAEQLLARTSG
jgi:tetratricopeptide (TPR) repeat protein